LSVGRLPVTSGGTIYVRDNIIAPQAKLYTDKVTITTKPIAELLTLIKLNADGSQTYLNQATAVIAGDGLSFTHASLSSGNIVIFTYRYTDVNTVYGLTTIKHYDSNKVAVSPNGTAWRLVPAVDNAGTVTFTAVQI